MEAAGPGESCVRDSAPWLQEMTAEADRSWLHLSPAPRQWTPFHSDEFRFTAMFPTGDIERDSPRINEFGVTAGFTGGPPKRDSCRRGRWRPIH